MALPTPQISRPAASRLATPSPVEQVLRKIEQGIERLGNIDVRDALGTARVVRLYGGQFTDPTRAFWKNEETFSVGVEVVVTAAGPLGATITIDSIPLVADTVGPRSARLSLTPNQSISIVFSDSAIEAALHVFMPTRPPDR